MSKHAGLWQSSDHFWICFLQTHCYWCSMRRFLQHALPIQKGVFYMSKLIFFFFLSIWDIYLQVIVLIVKSITEYIQINQGRHQLLGGRRLGDGLPSWPRCPWRWGRPVSGEGDAPPRPRPCQGSSPTASPTWKWSSSPPCASRQRTLLIITIIMWKQSFTNSLLDFQILLLRMLVPLRQPQRPHISSNTQNARSLEPGLSEVLLTNFISRTWWLQCNILECVSNC